MGVLCVRFVPSPRTRPITSVESIPDLPGSWYQRPRRRRGQLLLRNIGTLKIWDILCLISSLLRNETNTNYRTSKTFGPQTSTLFVELNERGKTTFSLRDVEDITGLRGSSARNPVFKAESAGWSLACALGSTISYRFELGRATEYIGDPYVIAKELCAGLLSVARLRDGTAAYGHPAATHNLRQPRTSQATATHSWS
jgi:hypothetical protein